MGASPRVRPRVFWAGRATRCSSAKIPNSSDFRLPELSLPASLPLERLDDRRGLLRMIDRQGELLGSSETARGIDAFYDRALTMLGSPKVKNAF